MQIFIILALVVAILAVIFALQNLAVVSISFLFWNIQGSLALVLLVTLAAGVLISFLVSVPGLIRKNIATSGAKKKLAAAETECSTYQARAEAAEKDVKTLEEQVASLSAQVNEHLSSQPQGDLPAASAPQIPSLKR